MASSSFALGIEGLVLHENVISQKEQANLVAAVDKWLEVGRKGLLPGKTYAPVPLSWAAAGQSREMLQFGAYTHSNRLELSTKVATLPPILLNLVRRLVASGQLPWPSPPCLPQSQAKVSTSKDDVSRASPGASSSVDSKPDVDKAAESSSSNNSASADSDAPAAEDSFEGVSSWCCTVNCYSPGQWIPPHIDNPKFARPFATLSLLSTQDTSFAPLPPPVLKVSDANESSAAPEIEATSSSSSSAAAAAAVAMEVVTDLETKSAASPAVADRPSATVQVASPSVNTFKEAQGAQRLPLRPGSLLVVGGASADKWTHAVPPVSERRISLTFRRLDPKVAAAAAAQVAAVAAAYASKGEMKRRAKQAAKEAKQAMKRDRKAASDAAASHDGGGDASSSSGAKSTPVPALMLRLLTALPQSVKQAETANDGPNMEESHHHASSSSFAQSSHHTPEVTTSDMVTDSSDPSPDEENVSVVRRPLIEQNHVMRLYDAIAPQWHGTRYRSWPKVDAFVASLPPGSLVCDAGCGNGKNLPACNAYRPANIAPHRSATARANTSTGEGAIVAADGEAESLGGSKEGSAQQPQPRRRGWGLGSDFSAELVKIVALERGMDALVADSLALPYRTGCFGACLSIAVLHHISSHPRRRRLMFECLRVVEVGGSALFYAWAQDQETGFSGHEFVEQDVLVPFHLRAPAPYAKAETIEITESADGVHKPVSPPVATGPAQPPRVNKRRLSPSSGEVQSNHGDASSNTNGSSSSSTGGCVTNCCDKSVDGSEAEAEASAAEGLAEYNATKGSLVFQRYCHVYRSGELTELAKSLNGDIQPWVEVQEEYYDTGNWCLIVRKILDAPSD